MKFALSALAIACTTAMIGATSAHTLALADAAQQPNVPSDGQPAQTAQDNNQQQPATPDTTTTQPEIPETDATQQVTPGTRTQPGTNPGVTPTTPDTDPQRDDAMVPQTDQDFLENAIQGSHAEIDGSQLALEKSEDAEVRDFAQMMIDDHQKMVQEASDLARQKGVEPPDGPSMMQTTEITALKALTGGAFDAMYVNRIGVAAHQSTIEMFEQAQQEVQDPDIRAMIDKTLPKLREHLRMAEALNQKQDNE